VGGFAMGMGKKVVTFLLTLPDSVWQADPDPSLEREGRKFVL